MPSQELKNRLWCVIWLWTAVGSRSSELAAQLHGLTESAAASLLSSALRISFTVTLISFLGLSCQWLVSRFLDRLSLIQFLVPFNVLLAGLFTSYWACVTTDPGGVPPKWEPPAGAREDLEVKRSTGGPRYCYKCSAPKPPRAHHCRVCRRCASRALE
jgi:hypothetical protein